MEHDLEELLSRKKRLPRGVSALVLYQNKNMQINQNLICEKTKSRFRLVLGNCGKKKIRFRGIFFYGKRIVLSRIELCSTHTNPSFSPPDGYEWLAPFKKMKFFDAPHLHFLIPSVGDIWAVPLEITDFEPRNELFTFSSYGIYCGVDDGFPIEKGLF